MHRYDPPDLQKSLAAAATTTEVTPMVTEAPAAQPSVQERELAQAKAKGALVEISPTSVVSENNGDMKELDQWDKDRGDDEFLCSDDDDSDDDLL